MEDEDTKEIRLKDETFIRPPPNPKYLRIYGHPLCPYVERLRHLLTLKKVPYQCAYVDLPSRPQWFRELGSSKGVVPIVELPNSEFFLHDSMACAVYIEHGHLDSAFHEFPSDPLLRAKLHIVLAKIIPFITEFYKVLKSFGENKEIIHDMMPMLQQFEDLLVEHNVEGEYLMDQKHLTLADIFLYPHLTRILLMGEDTKWADTIKALDFEVKYPLLLRWQKDMKKVPGIEFSSVNPEKFRAWLASYHVIRDIPKSLTIGDFC